MQRGPQPQQQPVERRRLAFAAMRAAKPQPNAQFETLQAPKSFFRATADTSPRPVALYSPRARSLQEAKKPREHAAESTPRPPPAPRPAPNIPSGWTPVAQALSLPSSAASPPSNSAASSPRRPTTARTDAQRARLCRAPNVPRPATAATYARGSSMAAATGATASAVGASTPRATPSRPNSARFTTVSSASPSEHPLSYIEARRGKWPLHVSEASQLSAHHIERSPTVPQLPPPTLESVSRELDTFEARAKAVVRQRRISAQSSRPVSAGFSQHGTSRASSSPASSSRPSSPMPADAQPVDAADASGQGFGGLRTTADGAKDYHLTRTLFHGQMVANLNALQILQRTPEKDMLHRLAELRHKFGSSRLGRADFNTWLSELVQVRIRRNESDLIFDAFDDNRSGGVDESEFVLGLQTILYDRVRSLIMFVKNMLADQHASLGAVMSRTEVDVLFDAIGNFARKKFPDIDRAIVVARKQVDEFDDQAQIPSTEFCRALEVSPLISHVLAIMNEDATLPPSPTPPPTPDPNRDITALPRVEAEAEAAAKQAREEAAALLAAGGAAADTDPASPASLTTEGSFSPRSSRRKRKETAKPPPVLSKLDVEHPAFKADEFVDTRRFVTDVAEHESPTWCVRHGMVWCRTENMGDFPVT